MSHLLAQSNYNKKFDLRSVTNLREKLKSDRLLEQSEASGHVTLHTLQRAAEALGCRLVYAVIPDRPLAETLRERAELVAARQLANVEQTMRLEDQAVQGKAATRELRRRLIEELLCHPARLWDEK
jgi:predicted DNA-binding mobile mystery protein A